MLINNNDIRNVKPFLVEDSTKFKIQEIQESMMKYLCFVEVSMAFLIDCKRNVTE